MKTFIRKFGGLLFCTLPLLLSLGIQVLISIPITFYYMVYKSAVSLSNDFAQVVSDILEGMMSSNFQTPVTVVWAISGICVFWYWFHKLIQRGEIKQISFAKAFHPLIFVSVFIIGTGMLLAITYACSGIELLHPDWFSFYNELMKQSTDTSLWAGILLFLYAVIIGPIHEELIFRGVTMFYAKKYFPFWFANLIQAALFGAMHMNLVQGIYAFAAGLVLGYVAHKGNNLTISILLHMIFNLLSSVLPFQHLSGSVNLNFVIAFLGCIVLVFGSAIYEAGIRIRNNQC